MKSSPGGPLVGSSHSPLLTAPPSTHALHLAPSLVANSPPCGTDTHVSSGGLTDASFREARCGWHPEPTPPRPPLNAIFISNGLLYFHILFAKIKPQRKELILGSFIQLDLFAVRIQSIQTQLSRAGYFSASSFPRACLGGETHTAWGEEGVTSVCWHFLGVCLGRDPALSFRALCVALTWPPEVSPHSLPPPHLLPTSILVLYSFRPLHLSGPRELPCVFPSPRWSLQVCQSDSSPITWTPPSAPVPAAL